MSDHLGTLIDILERSGVGGNELKELADEVNGERDPETGLRGAPAKKTASAKSE